MNMLNIRNGILGALLLIGLSLLSASAWPVVNVDFNDNKSAVWYQLNNVTYSGQGAYPCPSHNYWNGVVGTNETTTTSLLYADGITDSGLTLTFTSDLKGSESNTQAAKAIPNELTDDFLRTSFSWNEANIKISNLTPSSRYHLYLYGCRQAGEPTIFTISGIGSLTAAANGALASDPYWDARTPEANGNVYVVFSNVVASATGTIVYKFKRGNEANEAGFHSALQIVTVPEEGTVVIIK